jgi:hypothetical protein
MATLRTTTKIYIGDRPAMPGTLTIEQNNEVMWSNLPRANPSWSYTDRQGHKHAYVEDGDRYTTSTLDVEYEHIDCDGSCGDSGCEGYDIPHYSCRICGEEITPGLLHGPHSFVVEGHRSWVVDVPAAVGDVDDELPVRITTQSSSLTGTARVVDQIRSHGTSGLASSSTQLVGVSELIATAAGHIPQDPDDTTD